MKQICMHILQVKYRVYISMYIENVLIIIKKSDDENK